MKETHGQEIEAKLRQWADEIEALKAKSRLVGGFEKKTMDMHIEDLNEKKQRLQKKLEELKLASDEKWPSFKPGLVKAVKSLQDEFSKVLSKSK